MHDKQGETKRQRVKPGSGTLPKDRGQASMAPPRSRYFGGQGGSARSFPSGCTCCSQSGHVIRECPKQHLKCHNCGKTGHISTVCFSRGNNQRAGSLTQGGRPVRSWQAS